VKKKQHRDCGLKCTSQVLVGGHVTAKESTAFGLLARRLGTSKSELIAIFVRAALAKPDFDECFKCAKLAVGERLIRYSIGRSGSEQG
jgi:hypothetical protein